MAKEHTTIDVAMPLTGILPDELTKLLNDGWCLKGQFLNFIKGVCTVELEREVPDHEQNRT